MEKLIDNLEKAQKFSMGMAMKCFGEYIELIGKYIKGEITDEE